MVRRVKLERAAKDIRTPAAKLVGMMATAQKADQTAASHLGQPGGIGHAAAALAEQTTPPLP